MSDVEKAISGLVEDEELLQQQQQQQQTTTTPSLNQTNINNYNLQNETGNTLLHKHQQHHQQQQHSQLHQHQHHHDHQPDINYLTDKENNCLSRFVKLIFSTPGLVVMVIVYTIMGAFIFPLLEAPQDISKSAIIAKSREECLKELWIITEKLNVLYERNWTMLVHEQLRRFEGTIVAATRNMAAGAAATSGGTTGGYGMATETTTTALGRYGGSNNINSNNNLVEYSDLTATRWSFSEALLYSVTVITTIGHGSLTPRTAGGKIATILYALIGVPLMLMCLSSLGALLAEALQCTYARLCCRWPQYDEDGEPVVVADEMVQKSQRNKRLCRTEASVEKETHHEIKQQLQQCDYQDHKHGMNCKNCKYDAIIGETNVNHGGYDYEMCNDATTTTAMTTMKLGHKEDCCQLLQNSPGKFTQHLSSCMQLKMSPTISTAGSSTGTTTQAAAAAVMPGQQYYQQRPDVMLMTTGHKLSSQQATTAATVATTMAQGCRMVMPAQQRYYQNTTPTMATYHIVTSASANSSPTHHQAIRHYLVPQQPVSGMSSSGTQHFMAVPSNMVRFQTTSPHTSSQQQQQQHQQQHQQQQQCGPTTTSNINVNPLALPVSGSTTVYFPILTTAAATQQHQQQQHQTTSLTGAMGPSSAQPLVKYHTIQMPHKRQYSLSLQPDLQDNEVMLDVIIDGNNDATFPPPPPPPAYQTATVHGIRRAKFLTKPLPQEINTLLHESDISCRHDLSQNTFTNAGLGGEQHQQQQQQQQQQQFLKTSTATSVSSPSTLHSVMLSTEATPLPLPPMATTTMTTTAAAGTININNFCGSTMATTTTASSPSPASSSTLTNNTNSNNTTIYEQHRESTTTSSSSPLTHSVNTQIGGCGGVGGGGGPAGTTSTTAVDIMEDEEEHEQQRLGNCPHGTPSRVPLLTCSSAATEEKPNTRSFLNATAASFHRHTLNTFQRSSNTLMNQRKSMIINRKGECNLHITTKRRNSSCYGGRGGSGDHYNSTDDDDGNDEMELEGTQMYKLKQLHRTQGHQYHHPQHHPQHHHQQTDKHLHKHMNSNSSSKSLPVEHEDYDNHSLVSLTDSISKLPQVPIIVVLFILIFYVCLGTVIFALWENWSLIDGAYFCFVTLTTIGYGDFVPLRTFQGPEIQLFACCAYLLLGLVLVAMAFSILETQLIWKCKRLAVRLKLAKE